ncbi:MAG: hypothetical protein RR346_10305, partial [Bacteroidales bacterium]
FGMLNTVGSPKEIMIKSGMTGAFNQLIENGVFETVGSPLCFHQIFYGIDSSGEEARKEMLQETEKIIEQFVLDPNYCPFFG